MSSRPDLYRLATTQLAEEAASLAPPPTAPDVESKIVDAVAAAIVARAKARRRRRLVVFGGVGSTAAIAAAVAGLLLRSPRSPEHPAISGALEEVVEPVTVTQGASGAVVRGSKPLAPQDRIVVGEAGSAAIRLSTGTRFVLDPSASIMIERLDREQRFVLQRGAALVTVAKLEAGDRFSIHTADAEVEVRGTVFRVGIAEETCQGTTTRVVVTEGRVAVRHAGREELISAGERWPASCTAPSTRVGLRPEVPSGPAIQAPPVRVPSAAVAVHSPPFGETSPSPRTPRLPPSTPLTHAPPPSGETSVPTEPGPRPSPSELAEQNRVYGEAVSARRRGATNEAIAGFDAFLHRYPNAPLSESAGAERMRLLAKSDASRGREAARAYLGRWPQGFARAEAQSLLDHP